MSALRPEAPGDEPFLLEVYASTRKEELDAVGWPAEIREAFLRMQFQAQQRGYHAEFAGAAFSIILSEGHAIGRMVVDRAQDRFLLVEVAILPSHRGRGIGAALVQDLLREADAAQKPVRLSVLKGSRAGRWYQRLGFVKTGDDGVRDQMEWRGGETLPPQSTRTIRASLKLPLQFEPPLLQADLRAITSGAFIAHFNKAYYQGDWSVAPLRSIGGRADHIYPDPTARNAFADTPLLALCPYVRKVLASFPCPHQAVRFMRLKAGSVIREHKDYMLGFEDGEVRVHIPVVTNPEVEFVLNSVRVEMKEGESWYHNFNLPHSVANRGTADRIHLVLDCVLNDWLRDLLLSAHGHF